MADKPTVVPARYVGPHPVRISRQHGAVRSHEGKNVAGHTLRPGDIVMLPETEVRGHTYLFDPRGQRDPEYLGAGHVVKPEHAGLSRDELVAMGYEFQEGRSDFEPYDPHAPVAAEPEQPAAAKPAKAAKPAAV
ncbi:MAG: hypothetical protein IVW57_00200 [Ktedonobacterales bacterium]|nr:hypothetical protein [Ktedonobacterales bacterium]